MEGFCGIAVTTKIINLVSTYEYVNEGIGLIRLYPNPVADLLYLSFDNRVTHNSEIELMDMEGHLLFFYRMEMFANSKTIDLSDLPAGAYMLRITNEATSYVSKLIKL